MRIPRKKKKFLKKGFIVYWGNMHIQYTMDNTWFFMKRSTWEATPGRMISPKESRKYLNK